MYTLDCKGMSRMKSVVQLKLKTIANSVLNRISSFQSPNAQTPRSTAIRVGPNRVIFRVNQSIDLPDQQVESANLSTKYQYFYQQGTDTEAVLVLLAPRLASNSPSISNQDFKHQVTLKVKSVTKNLTVTYQDRDSQMEITEKILIE
jgi:hypothetical protein